MGREVKDRSDLKYRNGNLFVKTLEKVVFEYSV